MEHKKPHQLRSVNAHRTGAHRSFWCVGIAGTAVTVFSALYFYWKDVPGENAWMASWLILSAVFALFFLIALPCGIVSACRVRSGAEQVRALICKLIVDDYRRRPDAHQNVLPEEQVLRQRLRRFEKRVHSLDPIGRLLEEHPPVKAYRVIGILILYWCEVRGLPMEAVNQKVEQAGDWCHKITTALRRWGSQGRTRDALYEWILKQLRIEEQPD